MSGFEMFIYNLGALVFAGGIASAMFWLVARIERPRRARR